MNAIQLDLGFVLFMNRHHFDLRRVGNQRANHYARAIAQRMHAQQLVRIAMLQIDQTLQFSIR